ncbi:MAG: adenylate/guanylate cyclase domain-containing protein, partial [Pseudomonadota bacterium]
MDNRSDRSTRLEAVLFADLAGYSAYVARDESGALQYLQTCLAMFAETASAHGGEFVKSTGDGALLVFPSARQALDCAVRMLSGARELRPEGARNDFRIGVHIGEVERSGGDVLGHAVNLASRLEGEAKAGTVCVSQQVVSAVGRDGGRKFMPLGVRRLKNVPEPVAVWRLVDGEVEDAGAVAPPIAISIMNGLSLHIGDHVARGVEPDTLGALAVLALSQHGVAPVSKLAGILADDDADGPSRTAVAVEELRTLMGDALLAESGALRFDPALVEIDLGSVEAALSRGRVDPRLVGDDAWPDRLAEGVSTGRRFEIWLAAARAGWRDRIARALETRLSVDTGVGGQEVRELAEALLIVEPGHELAARRLMRALHIAGNPGGAMRVFDRLAEVLGERYGLDPQPDTIAVARGRRVDPTPRRATSAAPLRLQVRPIDDGAGARFDDFRSEVLSSLGAFRGWAVVEAPQGPARAGRSDYVLSARGSGEASEPRVTLSLTDASDDKLLWSEAFDLDVDRLHAHGRRAAGRIAATLEVYIVTDRVSRAIEDPDAAVVDAWLRGERLIGRWTPAAHDEAA